MHYSQLMELSDQIVLNLLSEVVITLRTLILTSIVRNSLGVFVLVSSFF